MPIPLAFLGSDNVAEFGRNCLTVVGGFIAGYIAGAIGCWAIDRWLFAKRSPPAAKKAISIIIGALVAALVAFILFGQGNGKGWFGGGDGSNGSGSNESPNEGERKTDPANPMPVDPKQPKIETPSTPELKSDDPKIRVTFLGGDAVQGDRFYLLDADPLPKTFSELKAFVLKKREASSAPLTLVVLFPTDPRQRIDPNSINVAQVTSWAETQGIGVYKPGKQ